MMNQSLMTDSFFSYLRLCMWDSKFDEQIYNYVNNYIRGFSFITLLLFVALMLTLEMYFLMQYLRNEGFFFWKISFLNTRVWEKPCNL